MKAVTRPARQKTVFLPIDLTPEEEVTLRRRAAMAGMEPSAWIRQRFLGNAEKNGIQLPADSLERRAGHGN